MSTLDANKARLSADDRYELATRAQNQQRLNAPRHLIAMGMVLLAVSLIAAGFAWKTQAGAKKKNEAAANNLVKIESLIEQIQSLQAASTGSAQLDILKPLPDILSTLESLGPRASLKNSIALPRNQNSRPEGDLILKTYSYENINDPSIERLLDWVRLAEQEIPGLHVREISIEPRQQYWSMDVILARYERKP